MQTACIKPKWGEIIYEIAISVLAIFFYEKIFQTSVTALMAYEIIRKT